MSDNDKAASWLTIRNSSEDKTEKPNDGQLQYICMCEGSPIYTEYADVEP